MSKIKIIVLVFLGSLLFPFSSLAFDIRGGETVEIEKNNFIHDDLLIAGATVRINGQVNGDIKAVGSIIEINGSVNGDVICVGSQIIIRGNVVDDLYVAGGQVNIEGKIGDNAIITGGNILISKNSEIGRDLRIYGGTAYLDGKVMGNVDGGAGQLKITNNVNGSVRGNFDKLIIGPDVEIAGDVIYYSPQEAEMDLSVEVLGSVDWTQVEPKAPYKQSDKYGLFNVGLVGIFIWNATKIISLILLGILLLVLFPKEIKKMTDRLDADPGNSLLWGLLISITIPVISVLMLITIIGIPISILLLSAFIISVYLAKIIVGLWIGRKILSKLAKKKEVSIIWSTIIGLIIIGSLCLVPLIGIVVKLLAILFGTGVIFMTIRNYFIKRK